jgi:hypothetical protein
VHALKICHTLRNTTKKNPRKMLSGKGRNGCIMNIVAMGDESMYGMDMSTTVEKPENTKLLSNPSSTSPRHRLAVPQLLLSEWGVS